VDTNTFLGQQVHKKWARLVVALGEGSLVVLVLLDALDVLVEEVGGVERAALGFGVELRAKDGARVVDQAFVGLVVEIREVLPPVLGEGRGVDGVPVVLRGDVAPAGGEVECRDVVSTVAVLQLDRLCASSESDQLVTHTDAHDGDLGAFEQFAEVVHSRSAVSWVTRSVGDEDTVEVVGHLVDGVVERETSNAGTSGHETAKNVLLYTTVDQSDMHVTERGAHVERSLCADAADQVDGFGVHVGLVLVGIILLADGDASQRRTLLTEVSYDLTGVNARDGWDTLASAPLRKTFDCGPVAVLERVVLDYNARRLNPWRLKVSEQAMLISGRRGHAVVADERLGEDEDLTTVRWVGHRLRVADERRGEDGLAGDVGFGAKRLSGEDRPILNGGE
jgi:hypothetical protein